MPETSPQQPAKPGTACLGCRRRKLKCTREEEGCSNCSKAELPCVYPTPETGVKRKRGPYKKDKPARERHLEDLVKYLEPKAARNDRGSYIVTSDNQNHITAEEPLPSRDPKAWEHSSTSPRLGTSATRNASTSEDLVKDALIALTKSSVSDRDSALENGSVVSPGALRPANDLGGSRVTPTSRQVCEYWHLYIRRVDPLVKIIHCPSFEPMLLKAMDDLQAVGPANEALLYSIFYAALGSCTKGEVRKRFGESREVLMQRYGRMIESTLANNYNMPVLETLQALVIYIIAIRRDDSVSNTRALFSLAVRMSQMIRLNEDPGENFTTFEAEMRRRLWWHLCGLESRGAEEGGARQTSIMESCNVRLPANLNDLDLRPDSAIYPRPRAGVTDMTFVLLRLDSVRLVQHLMEVRKKHTSGTQHTDASKLKEEQTDALKEGRQRLESTYLRHFDESRSSDWMCIRWLELIMTKARLLVEYPLGQVPTREMSAKERFNLLQASVDIIRISHSVAASKKVEEWLWYFRGWVQWHAIAVVIAELGGNKNQQFVQSAWTVLDPILADWDKVYKAKRDEPAWEHVNTLIERARETRQRIPVQQQDPTRPPLQHKKLDPSTSGNAFANNGLIQNDLWQSGTAQSNAMQDTVPPLEGSDIDQQQPYVVGNTQVSCHTGCAPMMTGFENADFGYLDDLDNIDFSAFDAVFGDPAWDVSSQSQSTDLNMEALNVWT